MTFYPYRTAPLSDQIFWGAFSACREAWWCRTPRTWNTVLHLFNNLHDVSQNTSLVQKHMLQSHKTSQQDEVQYRYLLKTLLQQIKSTSTKLRQQVKYACVRNLELSFSCFQSTYKQSLRWLPKPLHMLNPLKIETRISKHFFQGRHKLLHNSPRAGHLTSCDCFGMCYILLPNPQGMCKYYRPILFFHYWQNVFAGGTHGP